MITCQNNNGSPVNPPNTKFGSCFDGTSFHFFESNEEREAYLSSLVVEWNKQAYCAELNEAHTQLLFDTYKRLGYLDYSEVESWARTERTDNRSLQWKEEAQSIIEWYQDTCIYLYDYMDAVTEESALSIEVFLNTLPSLNL